MVTMWRKTLRAPRRAEAARNVAPANLRPGRFDVRAITPAEPGVPLVTPRALSYDEHVMADERPGAGRVLVVCTGNVCRSPYLERRLHAELSGTGIVVRSAGTAALEGSGMEPQAADLLAQAGGDAEGFEARQLTAQMVRDADLVLCATRDHRTSVVRLEPKGLRRTFAALDFADLTAHIPPGPLEPSFLDPPDANLVQQVVAAATLHRDEVHARLDHEADVIDPFHRGAHEFTKMAEQLEEAIEPIVSVLREAAQSAR